VRDEELNISIVPAGTGISFCIISQHFVLGYFRQVPPGLIFTTANDRLSIKRSLSDLFLESELVIGEVAGNAENANL
jgi:hypothetical protein